MNMSKQELVGEIARINDKVPVSSLYVGGFSAPPRQRVMRLLGGFNVWTWQAVRTVKPEGLGRPGGYESPSR